MTKLSYISDTAYNLLSYLKPNKYRCFHDKHFFVNCHYPESTQFSRNANKVLFYAFLGHILKVIFIIELNESRLMHYFLNFQ